MWFHVVNAGRGWLEVDGDEPRLLQPGDFALVPTARATCSAATRGPDPGSTGWRTTTPATATRSSATAAEAAPTSIVCGTVRFGHPAARNLVALLPRTIVVEGAPGSPSPEADWMHGTLRLIAAEGRRAAAGRRGRDHAAVRHPGHPGDPRVDRRRAGGQTGWLGRLQDPRIGQAMSLVHRDPAQPWSVASLARGTAMSRSAFAARFTELVGEPVMRYVTRWRMQVALDWLRHDDVPVAELAARLGYESEAAFSRAFKRMIGISPGASRRSSPDTLGESPHLATA